MCDIAIDTPVHKLGLYYGSVERKLKSAIQHIADIAKVSSRTGGLRNRDPKEQVLGLLGIDIDVSGETLLKEIELNTEVKVGGRLPGDILITQLTEARGHIGVR